MRLAPYQVFTLEKEALVDLNEDILVVLGVFDERDPHRHSKVVEGLFLKNKPNVCAVADLGEGS